MAKFAHADVLDGGLNVIKNNATTMLLIKAYTAGDSYATVVGNAVASVSMASGDFTIAGAANAPRVLTVAAKSSINVSANSGTTPDLHIALTDGTSRVLWVTDETQNQQLYQNNTVNIPSFSYTASQPV